MSTTYNTSECFHLRGGFKKTLERLTFFILLSVAPLTKFAWHDSNRFLLSPIGMGCMTHCQSRAQSRYLVRLLYFSSVTGKTLESRLYTVDRFYDPFNNISSWQLNNKFDRNIISKGILFYFYFYVKPLILMLERAYTNQRITLLHKNWHSWQRPHLLDPEVCVSITAIEKMRTRPDGWLGSIVPQDDLHFIWVT